MYISWKQRSQQIVVFHFKVAVEYENVEESTFELLFKCFDFSLRNVRLTLGFVLKKMKAHLILNVVG